MIQMGDKCKKQKSKGLCLFYIFSNNNSKKTNLFFISSILPTLQFNTNQPKTTKLKPV
jgi:hypothetical protein